jgi:hypothetical protein
MTRLNRCVEGIRRLRQRDAIDGIAGLVGSLCWLGWMIALGVFLLRAAPEPSPQPVTQLEPTLA